MKNKINMKRYFQVLGASLAVVFAVMLVCLGFNFFDTKSDIDGLTADEIATVETSDGKINVLVMGVDKDGLRTDAIMLVSYDTEANTIKGLSIPRDTRMYIGSRYQKINAAHAVGASSGKILGAQGTVEAVSRLTAIPINYYVDFTFEGVEKCMDALGPVEFEIPDLNNDGVGMVYDDPAQDLHINLKPGLQELNGEQIVHLLRYRKGNKINGVRRTYANGDIDRIAVQQDFLKALADQKLNASLILKMPSIFKELSSEINTNLTVKDVLKYSKYLKDFSSTNISIFSLPGNFSGGQFDASYWICDLDATRELVETEFGYDASNITIDKSVSDKKTTDDKSSSSEKKTTGKSDSSSSEKKTATKATAKPKATATAKTEPKKTEASTKNTESTEKPKANETKSESTPKPESTPKQSSSSASENETSAEPTAAPKHEVETTVKKEEVKTNTPSENVSQKQESSAAVPEKKTEPSSNSEEAVPQKSE